MSFVFEIEIIFTLISEKSSDFLSCADFPVSSCLVFFFLGLVSPSQVNSTLVCLPLGISSWLCWARVYVQPPVWLSVHFPISLSLSEWVTRFRIYRCHCPHAFSTVYGLVWFCFGEERVSGSTSTSLLSSSHFIRIPTYGRQGSDRKIQATVYTPRIKGFMKE